MDPYPFYLFLHLLGVVLWLGLTLTMAFVTGRASRTGDLGVAAFAYGAAARLNRTVGLTGMLLTVLSGFAMLPAMGYRVFELAPHWLFQMQVLGLISFAVGAVYLIPLTRRLAGAAEASASAGEPSTAFLRYRKRYALVSSIIGGLLLIVLALGALKP